MFLSRMSLQSNFYTTFYLLFSGFCGLCYGFVLLSSATGANGLPQTNAFEPGSGWIYDYKSTVLLNEKDVNDKDVGFLISGIVSVEAIWGSNSNLDRLLKFELQSPQLHIRSRKAPAPDGFVHHSSQLDSLPNTPFLVEWSHGKIQKILLQKDEPISLANLKKGIASLFQFQILDQETNETDASGFCKVTYASTSSNEFIKSKSDCSYSDLPLTRNPDIILSTKIESSRTANYELDDKNRYINTVISWETHSMFTAANENIGNKIESYQTLTLTETKTVESIEADSFTDAVDKFSTNFGLIFTQESLVIEKEALLEESKSFLETVKEYRENLKNNVIGTLLSAKAISKLVSAGKNSNKDNIAKTLGLKKNQAILHQLYDILGYVQTDDSHAAAMKKLHFDDPKHEEFCERYLWALSISSQPNPDIIMDLLKRQSKTLNIQGKVKETLMLTIASMAYRLSKLPIYENHLKVYRNVEEAIINGLDYSKGESRFLYLRALKNLKSVNTFPKLIEIVKSNITKETVLAWKALHAFEPAVLPQEVIDVAIKTFFELNKKEDSSARTLAIDIIINSKPTDELLRKLLHILISDSKSFEIHQYLIQRLNMVGAKDNYFKKRINEIIKSDYRLNNYDVMSQRGLSTALTRQFLRTSFSNGSLESIQEIQSGIVKRGIVNIVLEKEDVSQEMFSLGIFSGGLSSFISSDSEEQSDESATAGIELTILGTQIRPFVFFDGQGELMGHVWSGTASEKTPAFQALAVVQDHLQYIRLGTGFISVLDLKGSTSFDLSGKIEISLWNRNAAALVEKSAGIVILGAIQVDTSFVRSQVEFSVSMEPKLNLETDIDFSSRINLCMKLSQPDLVFRHNMYKIERIPGSKHRLRKVKYRKYVVPGRTYSLNKKNNDMCNAMFKQF